MRNGRGEGRRHVHRPWVLVIVVLLVLPAVFTQLTDEHYVVEPTPALRLGNEDLTTVLLVNNDNRSEARGRFLSVRPAVGLLTSTARTFIQEGVTTEYATQVLGTTLDNGRLYAQLLKKSSRVLYDKEKGVAPSTTSEALVHTSIIGESPYFSYLSQPKSLLQSHNDLVADKDWQDVDDGLLRDASPFVGNTDYIGGLPRPSHVVFPVNAEQVDKPEQIQKFSKQESYSVSKSETTSHRQDANDAFRIKVNKVNPSIGLATFTVRNVFSPSGYSEDSVGPRHDDNEHRFEVSSRVSTSEQRSPKLLYHQVMKEEHRPLLTVTYYGFADFTTIVGDSVIVFSPSTSTNNVNPAYVTSIKGEATLGRQESSFVSNVPITITQDLIEPTLAQPVLATTIAELPFVTQDMATKVIEDVHFHPQARPDVDVTTETSIDSRTTTSGTNYEPGVESSDSKSKDSALDEAVFAISKPSDSPDHSVADSKPHDFIPSATIPGGIEESTEQTTTPTVDKAEADSESEHPKEADEVILQPSISDIAHQSTTTTTELQSESTPPQAMLSTPSNEDILRIYSMLASAELAKRASEVTQMNAASVSVEPSKTTESPEEDNNPTEPVPTTPEPVETTTSTNEEPIQPDIKVQGGATTIFFEDDPFLDFITPSSAEAETSSTLQIQPSRTQVQDVTPLIDDHVTTADNQVDVEAETSPITEPVSITDSTEPDTTTTSTEGSLEDHSTPPSTDKPVNAEIKPEPKQPEEQEIQKESNNNYQPIVKEIKEDEVVEGCSRTSQVFLTQVPKTLTYYTTFFIPQSGNPEETETSIETNIVPSFDIAEATKHYCIQPTQAVSPPVNTETAVLERPSKPEESNVIITSADEETRNHLAFNGASNTLTTHESTEVTEPEVTEATDSIDYEDEEDEDDDESENEDTPDSADEVEYIYKTLYTTYTYLTTFFHDSETSISSRKEIVTNVITSTIGANPTEPSEITPTTVHSDSRDVAPTSIAVPESDLAKIDGILRKDTDLVPTTPLDPNQVAKTYYTTYTYYTTIFVDGETEVMSRTEVHTNVIGKTLDAIAPSARNLNIDESVLDEENAVIDIRPTPTYDTIQRTATAYNDTTAEKNLSKYKTIIRGAQELESLSSSSSSKSEKKVVPLLNKPNDNRALILNGNTDTQIIENGILDDQISLESNTDEIIPSATLLLQTSFTTFTYYTTMYNNDATNVVSRLETVTNVVTETLQPTKTLNLNEVSLPITYFTTYTYWTKLAKENGEITTLSREETVSNIVAPTALEASEEAISPTAAQDQQHLSTIDSGALVEDALQTSLNLNEPTTYYTTYTYYTTSYAGDQTITDSRFETVSNVVTPTKVDDTSDTPVVTSNLLTDSEPVPQLVTPPLGTSDGPNTISYDYKTIVDAEGISTLYFKTEVIATNIDGTPTEITSKTSTINIDEVKKALSSPPSVSGTESTRTYKTGLVRLIEGTQFSNHTSTIYQSKVIGTIIDDRYAQIIESTSSFIVEKTRSPALAFSPEINPTSTQPSVPLQSSMFVPPNSEKPIESSIGNVDEDHERTTDHGEEDGDDEEGDDNGEEGENGRQRTRLSFQSKKKTFTPVIRPFASRNRPQFAPKRKNLTPSSATIITRSDVTPTITATPALKSESRGRFSSSRRASSAHPSSGIGGGSSTGGKRFSRPSKSSQYGGSSSSSAFSGSSRNRPHSSRNSGPSSSYSGFAGSRRTGFRSSTSSSRSFSSAYVGNSRLRIRPSNSQAFEPAPNTASFTTLPPESEEDAATQGLESEEDADATTENLRRNKNPLLRFRRPPVNRPPFQPGQRNQVSPRRNPLTPKPKTTTTTTTTTQRTRPRSFQRPPLAPLQNRLRPQNSLFPPRRLFEQQPQEEELKQSEDDSDLEAEDNDSAEYESDEDIATEDDQDEGRRRRDTFSHTAVKKRSKREADSAARINFRNRFRRPSTQKPSSSTSSSEERDSDSPDEEVSTLKSRLTSRFSPRTHGIPTSTHSTGKTSPLGRAIRPTKSNPNNRPQFTLREKDTTTKHTPRASSPFRRPSLSGVTNRRTTTAATRSKSSRFKPFGSTVTEPSHSSPRTRTTSRPRANARGRSRNDFTMEPVLFDGTLTITHTAPAETTIPVVNGQITEYKNIVTTTTSTEVVVPNQYTAIIGQNGVSTLVLNREESTVNINGGTEVTQFVLHEIPTTTVIFTPTVIRGRKTSFAHVIPSTAYQVENVVSTMAAQINANAPLANILLSQLLLGNIGLNNANLNPLLALGATQAVPQAVAATPVTEFKVRTSTYVTTVVNGMPTVLPVTFRGSKIYTTIYDSTSDIITATEYITDTIVVTPSVAGPPPAQQQVNSLLLPLLLQQQLQGQQPLQGQPQPVLPIQNSIAPQLLLPDNIQDIDNNAIQKYNDYNEGVAEDYPVPQEEPVTTQSPIHKTEKSKSGSRKNGRKPKKQHNASPSLETSVITLYVSGRRPGEFSTVLSTVQVGGDSSLRKRHVSRPQRIYKSDSPDTDDYYTSDGSEIQEYLLPATFDITSSHNMNNNHLSAETQSLESIVGDVNLWYAKTSAHIDGPHHKTRPTIYTIASDKNSKKPDNTKPQSAPFSQSIDPNDSSEKYFLV